MNIMEFQSTGNPLMGKAFDNLAKKFMAKHPNITVARQSSSFADMQTKQELIASGPTPPDIQDMAANFTVDVKLAQAGLLADLKPYADAYGWTDKFSPFLYGQFRFKPDTGAIETGDPYGIYLTEDVVGIYYNREVLKSLGVSVPKSFDEFEKSLATIKSKGVTPMVLGNLSSGPGVWTYQLIQNSLATRDALRDYSYRLKSGQSFDEPWNLTAAKKFLDWSTNGYLGSDPNSVNYDASKADFLKGKTPYYVNGTWEAANVSAGLGDKAGFFLSPPPGGDENKLVTVGGVAQTWAVSGKSKHPEVAAALLDYFTSDDAAKEYMAIGSIPGFKHSAIKAPSSSTPVEQDVAAQIARANGRDALVGYLDGPTPRMLDVLTSGFQNLVAGKTTAQGFVSTVQADYAKGTA